MIRKKKKKKRKLENRATSEKKGTKISKVIAASPQGANEARKNLSNELLQFRRGK